MIDFTRSMKCLIAGFGGQGILFTGKLLAYIGLTNGKEVSWLPSYGPEMRGGTANCGVIISDTAIGSPIVDTPDILLVMNGPSLEKYEKKVTPGGLIVYDSTLVSIPVTRGDIDTVGVPATALADENGYKGLANMILLGAFIKHSALCGQNELESALKKVIPERKKDMYEVNLRALALGRGD